MERYVYKDGFGGELEISPGEGGYALVDMGTDDHARVGADDLPEVVAKLYEAAGEEVPLLTVRQQVREDGSPVRYGDFAIGREGDRVTIGIHGIEGSTMPPGAALVLAGYIAALVLAGYIAADGTEAAAIPARARLLGHAGLRRSAALRFARQSWPSGEIAPGVTLTVTEAGNG